MIERTEVGVEGMDKLLNGGLPKGRTVLLSGTTGTGKTIFASQFAKKGVENGEPCVFVTFEQSKKKLIEDMREIGVDLEELEKTGKFRLIGGPVAQVEYFKEKTKAKISDIVAEIVEVVQEINAQRVVLDSVNLFTMLFETDAQRRRALAELSATLDDLGCTSLLTCEAKEGTNNLSWYGFEEFVVDGVIVLFRKPIGNLFIRALAVVKMRGISHSRFVYAVGIEKDGLKVYPTEKLGKDFNLL